jgi:putative FmdB family regulatory protein
MPWYDYRCPKCKHEELDIKRSIKENVLEYECPKCGAKMKQIIRKTSFKLKGGGWAKDKYTKPAKNDS